jgi:hypothetical protein
LRSKYFGMVVLLASWAAPVVALLLESGADESFSTGNHSSSSVARAPPVHRTESIRAPSLYRPCVRRTLLALYALILVGEVAWQQLVPLAPDLKEALGLDATRTGTAGVY